MPRHRIDRADRRTGEEARSARRPALALARRPRSPEPPPAIAYEREGPAPAEPEAPGRKPEPAETAARAPEPPRGEIDPEEIRRRPLAFQGLLGNQGILSLLVAGFLAPESAPEETAERQAEGEAGSGAGPETEGPARDEPAAVAGPPEEEGADAVDEDAVAAAAETAEEIEAPTEETEELDGAEEIEAPEETGEIEAEAAEPEEVEEPGEAAAEAEGAGEETEMPAEEVVAGSTEDEGEGGAGEGDGAPSSARATAAEMSAWQSQVRQATVAVPAPSMGSAAEAPARVRRGGSASASGLRRGRDGLAREASEAVPPPPEDVEPRPAPPPTPVPEADRAIAEASDKKLSAQTLPALQRSPFDTLPTVQTRLAPDLATRLAPPEPEAGPGEAGSYGAAEDPNAERAERIREAAGTGPDTSERSGDGAALVLEDTAPPPGEAPAFSIEGETRQQLAAVLGTMLENTGDDADAILTEARKTAYPNEVLDIEYPEIGSERAEPLAQELTTQIESIRDQAGLTADELDAAVASHRETLAAEQTAATEEVEAAGEEAREEVETEGQETADAVEGARQAADEHTEAQLTAAAGEDSPEVIELRRDNALSELTRRAVRQDVYYEQAGERRSRSLDAAGQALENAYTMTARQDQRTLTERYIAEGRTEEEARAEGERGFTWASERIREVRGRIGELKTESARETTGYRGAMTSALDEARRLVREWADGEIDENSSWWDRLWRLFSDWAQDARDDTAAWAEARNAATRDAMVGHLGFVSNLQVLAAQDVDHEAILADRSLSDEQRAIVTAYFTGSTRGDAIAAVGAGVRSRIASERKPGLMEDLRRQLIAKPNAEWEKVGRVGAAEGRFNVTVTVSQLRRAIDQWGTDEAQIYSALSGLTPTQTAAVRKLYGHRWGSLDADLESELSGAELTRAESLLSGDRALADAAALNEAVSGWGTDEATIMTVLRGKTEEERQAILDAYQREYGVDLRDDLRDDMEDHDLDRAEALLAGDVARADAIALDQAMHGGVLGWGTDEEEITAVYDQVRREVEAEGARRGWDTARIEQEIRSRHHGIEGAYESEYGDPERADGESALRAAFRDEMEGPDLDLALALADNDMVAADAARLEIERTGFITDDDVVNGILRSQYQRGRREVERDLRLDLQSRAEIARLRGEPWDQAHWQRERDGLSQRIDEEARARGREYMGQLEDRYDSEYSRWGSGGLQVLIAFNMSGNDQEMARDLLAQGGYLEPEQEIHYAIDGPGTDVGALRSTLAGKSRADVQRIREAWERDNPRQDFDQRILSELSGRDEFDIGLMLEGEPQTPEERLARERRRLEYEQNAYWLGGLFSDEEREWMEERFEALERDVNALSLHEEGSREHAQAQANFELSRESFDRAVEDHREAVDTLADTAATVAGVVATLVVIVGAVVLTVVTGGAAAPGVAAAIGAVMSSASTAALAAGAAAGATVLTKQLLKGDAYGIEEMGVDIAVGVIDAAAAGLTAGMGAALLKVTEGLPMGALARMATSNRAATRVLAHGLAEGAEGVASTLPSALTGNLLNERNWRHGSPFLNILSGTMVETGIAVGLGAGLGGLGGLGPPPGAARAAGVDEVLPGGRRILADTEAPDVLARRGTPADRLALWQEYRQANPGRGYGDFLDDLDAGIVARQAADDAGAAVQRDLRRELLSGVPPAQRGELAGTVVEVVSDADFERLTRSASGQAVVLMEGGRPRVLLRESADPRVLREEGIHLLQSRDPRFAAHFRSLDEADLARWDTLDLADQLRLYRNKMELEIDAHERLIRGLDEELAAAGDDAALRRSLRERIDEASDTLDNLRTRFDEVEGITPDQRLRMAAGELDRPEFLDQPARLFAKPGDAARVKALLGDDAYVSLRRMSQAASSAKSPEARAASRSVTKRAAELAEGDPNAARRFIEQVQAVRDGSPRRSANELAELFSASTRTNDSLSFLDDVLAVSSLPKMRGEQLATLGRVIDGIAQGDPNAAARLLKQFRDAADLSRAGSEGLEEALERFGREAMELGVDHRVVEVLNEELSRSGRWDWGSFRRTMAEEFPEVSGPERLQMLLDGWQAEDFGPIVRWREVIENLDEHLTEAGRTRFWDRLETLLGALDPGYNAQRYRDFRHLLREQMLEHLAEITEPAAQVRALRVYLDQVGRVDPASKGALFTRFRQQAIESQGRVLGPLRESLPLPDPNLQLTRGRVADGAMRIPDDIPDGPPAGRYLIDDKAGPKAYDPVQATDYSEILRTGETEFDGLVYMFENLDEATRARRHMLDQGLDRRIHIAVIDPESHQFRFLPRKL